MERCSEVIIGRVYIDAIVQQLLNGGEISCTGSMHEIQGVIGALTVSSTVVGDQFGTRLVVVVDGICEEVSDGDGS